MKVSRGYVVRALRTLAGLVLVLIGFPALIGGAAGIIVLQHCDPDGAFSTQLAPIHADGYAVVVSDVDTTVAASGAAGLLGSSGRLRVSLRASNVPVLLALAHRDDVERYLAGVPVTQLTAIGFARGDSPVTTTALAGTRPPLKVAGQTFWVSSGTAALDWDPAGGPVSLVVLRTDGQAGLDVTLAVSHYPTWIKPATLGLLLAGLAGLLGGIVLLFVAAEPVLVVEAHRMVEFADRIAERLERTAPGESLAVVRRARGLDLTGELVTVRPERAWNAPYERGPGDPESGPAHAAPYQADPAPRAVDRRWRDAGHTPPELADRWAADNPEDDGGPGESPYVHTAT